MTGLLEWNRPSHSYHTGLKHEKKRGKTAKINIFKKIFPLNLKILIYQIYANIFWRTFLVSICCGRQRLWRGGNNKVQPHFFYFLAYFLLWTFLCRQFWFFFLLYGLYLAFLSLLTRARKPPSWQGDDDIRLFRLESHSDL